MECLAVVLARARCDRRWISAGVNVGEGEGSASSALVRRRWDACLSCSWVSAAFGYQAPSGPFIALGALYKLVAPELHPRW